MGVSLITLKSSFAGDSWDLVHKLLSCWFFSQEVAGNIAT
jgi:hypothetical protein